MRKEFLSMCLPFIFVHCARHLKEISHIDNPRILIDMTKQWTRCAYLSIPVHATFFAPATFLHQTLFIEWPSNIDHACLLPQVWLVCSGSLTANDQYRDCCAHQIFWVLLHDIACWIPELPIRRACHAHAGSSSYHGHSTMNGQIRLIYSRATSQVRLLFTWADLHLGRSRGGL